MALTINTKIITRSDTSENWNNVNPVLSRGQIGYDTTVKKHKIGDGISTWQNLPYFALESDINSKVEYLVATSLDWSAQTSLISTLGTFYIYSDYNIIEQENEKIIYEAGVKIGDGTSFVVDLPFVTITSRERQFWNNKVRCYIDETIIDSENLIFTTH